MVFDRFRRPPRLGEPVQTVWMVQLPMALPYLSSADLAASADPTASAWPEPLAATVAGVTEVRRATANLGRDGWWIDGGYLFHTAYRVSTRMLGEPVERLTALVAALPWPALQQLATQHR
jgi:hypothetical protein